MKIEAEDQPEELKMAYGIVVKTKGRVRVRASSVMGIEVKFLPRYFPP